MERELLSSFVVALPAVFFVVDPFGVVPIFLAITARDPGKARQMAMRACLVGSGLLLFFALFGGLIFKVFAITVAFWTTTFWMFVGEAIFGAALLAIGSYRRQLRALLRNNAAALLTINGSNELINLGGGLGNRYALMFAPLSIVQAISSTPDGSG